MSSCNTCVQYIPNTNYVNLKTLGSKHESRESYASRYLYLTTSGAMSSKVYAFLKFQGFRYATPLGYPILALKGFAQVVTLSSFLIRLSTLHYVLFTPHLLPHLRISS